MKRIIVFLLLFAAIKVAGQTTGYLRFDTVRIMKQNGTCELYIINKTKDSLGLLTNVGGGLTQFKRSRALTDSTLIVGNDTIKIMGGSLARNGVTKNGAYTELGGSLIQNTDISMGGDSLRMKDSGWVRIRTASGTASPPLIVENKTPGAFENISGIGDNVAWRLKGNLTNGFVGLSYYTGEILRWSTGYDGNADHGYIADIRNTPSATIEVDGSTFAAFTRGKNFGIGDLPVRDSARINVYTRGTGYTTSDSSNRWFVGQNYGSTFNTTGGAIINRPFVLINNATRSSGSNALTNVGMFINTMGAQNNYALRIDSGDVVVRGIGSSNANMNVADFATVANLGVTQKRIGGWFEVGRTLTDTIGGTETFSSGVRGNKTYAVKGSAVIPDNLSGSAGDFALSLVANHTGYTGRTVYQGIFTPSNNVTTMAAGVSARMSLSQAQTGGNSLRTNGWFAALSTHIALNTGDSLSNFVWGNFGAAQTTGGAIDSGYAVYINALPTLVATKYAIYQAGTSDSSIYKGPLKTFNFQADKTITAGGTTGDQTINKISGTVNFAATATTLTVTNSYVTTSSIVFCTVRTNDGTAYIKNVVPGSGSFVITLGAAATAETSVGFLVVN